MAKPVLEAVIKMGKVGFSNQEPSATITLPVANRDIGEFCKAYSKKKIKGKILQFGTHPNQLSFVDRLVCECDMETGDVTYKGAKDLFSVKLHFETTSDVDANDVIGHYAEKECYLIVEEVNEKKKPKSAAIDSAAGELFDGDDEQEEETTEAQEAEEAAQESAEQAPELKPSAEYKIAELREIAESEGIETKGKRKLELYGELELHFKQKNTPTSKKKTVGEKSNGQPWLVYTLEAEKKRLKLTPARIRHYTERGVETVQDLLDVAEGRNPKYPSLYEIGTTDDWADQVALALAAHVKYYDPEYELEIVEKQMSVV